VTLRARFAAPLLGALSLVALAAPAAAQEKTLNVYNWTDYIGETTLADFEKETGIKVTYDMFDSNETLDAKLKAGRSGYDVVVPSAEPFLSSQIQAGIYQKLDRSKIPNYANLDPKMMKGLEVSDPGNQYAVPYLWGTIGIGYNVDKVKQRLGDNAPIGSLDLLMKPENVSKLKDCGVVILDSPTEVLPIVLNYLGLDPASQKKEDLTKAEAALKAVRPSVRKFHGSQYVNDLANGDACIALGYSGDIVQAQSRAEEAKNNVKVEYFIPKEGTVQFFDTVAIPKDAKNVEAAHQFINFILDPKNMAGISNYVVYGNAVPKSLEFLAPEVKSNEGAFPPPDVMAKLFVAQPVDPKFERERTRAWTRIKTGK